MDLPHFDIRPLLTPLPQKEIVGELLYPRDNTLKLSEVKIDKRSFKYLKKMGVYDSFLPSGPKKWHLFTITEQVVLKIAEVLWKYGFDDKVIKSVVEALVSDNWLKQYLHEGLFSTTPPASSVLANDNPSTTFFEYCILERQRNPHLIAFTNLEALIVSTFISRQPISIVVNQYGRWRVFSGLDKADLLSLSFQETMFRSSFLNISLKEVVDELFVPNHKPSPILNPNSATGKNIGSLISKGFNHQDVREIEMDNPNIELEIRELSKSANIAKIKNEFSDQDILMKVRQSKVVSVKQLVIKKVKKGI